MMTFHKNVPDRKVLRDRLSELTGLDPVYTRAPLYEFHIGPYRISRDGDLLVEEGQADTQVLGTLVSEGLIRMTEAVGETEDADAMNDDPAPAEPFDIAFPMDGHTGRSLRNLVYMLYSRAGLLHRSVGSSFHVEKGLTEALEDDIHVITVADVLDIVHKYEETHGPSLEGLELREDELVFNGFDQAATEEVRDACRQLAELMVQTALRQQRVQCREHEDVENERYALRTWLIRLGMTGDEYKAARRILMRNLSGHTAFRTPEEAERAREKTRRRREMWRAEREQDAAERQAQDPAPWEDVTPAQLAALAGLMPAQDAQTAPALRSASDTHTAPDECPQVVDIPDA